MAIAQKQAEEHFDDGKLGLACTIYQRIMEDVELGYDWPPQPGRPSRCYGIVYCDKAICFAELNVRNRLSEICLALGNPIEALKWVNSALLMFSNHQDCTDANGTRISHAELRYRFALASHQMDVRYRALDSIDIALKLDPDNGHYKRVLQEWLAEEAEQPHIHGGSYPKACERSISWHLASSEEYGSLSTLDYLSQLRMLSCS